MESQKNNKGVIMLLVVIIIILSVFCILFLTGTIKLNNNDNSDENNVVEEKEEDNDYEFDSNIDSLVGVWGYYHYVIIIQKQNDGYVYTQGKYATDGGIGGIIKNIKEVYANKYVLELFIEGCVGDGCIEEKEGSTKFVLIEIDKTKNVIINNTNEYEFITKDSTDYDTVHNYFFN